MCDIFLGIYAFVSNIRNAESPMIYQNNRSKTRSFNHLEEWLITADFKKKIAVVIPAYNEGCRISKVIPAIHTYAASVIVVNDYSVDDTSAVARSSGATVIDLPANKGAGYATR